MSVEESSFKKVLNTDLSKISIHLTQGISVPEAEFEASKFIASHVSGVKASPTADESEALKQQVHILDDGKNPFDAVQISHGEYNVVTFTFDDIENL